MRFGGEATSVLWGDTASLSPPLDSSRPTSKFAASEVQTAAMNCFEGLPPASHHHHAIHHAHHPHVIHLLPHSAPATPPTTPNNNLAASPPPEDGEFARKEEAPTSSSEPEMTTQKDTTEVVESSEAASPLSTEGQVAQARVKEEVDDGNIQDDSGISPGSRGSGSSAERVRDAECGHSSGREEEEEGASPSHHSEEQECPSPGSSERGPSGEGRGDDGARCASSPFSEECYSGGEDSDALRRLQFSVDRGATFASEDAGSQGGDTYDGSGPRPDGMGSDEDDGSDINMTKPRITSQGKFKTFRCKQCDFVGLTKLEFWEHSKMHIRAERLLTCPRCPFVTEYKHHLEYHLRNHFGSKPFKCPHCPYTCVNKSMLNSHLKSHSSVYQYRCADCGYATKYCHSLKLHLRKYSHQPAMVLHPDGSPNPLPVIDVYGTRRGPKTGSKKCSQQSVGMDTCATTVHSSNTSTTSPTLVTSVPVSVATPTAIAAVPVTTSGHQYPAMLVYPSPPSPSQQTPKTAAPSTYILPNGGAYFSTPMQATSSNISYSTFSTPQTSRPILPRVLHPTRETEVAGGSDASQMQWPREDAEQANGRKILSVPNANNRPVKCTLCEFASTSREAFAEHMMMHAANGDVGNKDTGVSQSESKVSHQIHQQHPVLMTNGNGFAPNNEAGLKEYLARMLTAVVPQMGAYRGPVPPQLQAQWHVHVQQQMQQQQRMQQMQHQPQTNGMVLPQTTPASPQQVQRPWLNKDGAVTPSLEKPAEPRREGEVEATEVKSSERPGGGVPLDLTKESAPRLDSEKHIIEERKGMGGSSRRKGRAFKLERISQRLQGEEEGKSSEEEDDRHSQHSEEEVSESVKRRKFCEDIKAKVDRNKDDKEDYHCPYCDIAFRDVVLYTMHMGYHGYQDPFKCNMCGQETNDKVSFFLHIARSSHS